MGFRTGFGLIRAFYDLTREGMCDQKRCCCLCPCPSPSKQHAMLSWAAARPTMRQVVYPTRTAPLEKIEEKCHYCMRGLSITVKPRNKCLNDLLSDTDNLHLISRSHVGAAHADG